MQIATFLKAQKENIFFLIILTGSALFYLFNLTFSDLWIDETFTQALVEHSFSDMLGLIKNDFHPPLYFYGLKIFITIFGISAFTLRLFSIVAVLSTMVLGYFTGRRVFGKAGALYFCLLIFALPMLACYSHNARMYTWGAFFVTGIFLYAVLFITTNKRKDLFFLLLFSLLAAYTHYYGLIAAFWANVFVLVFNVVKKNKIWRVHVTYSLGVVLLYLPWMLVLLHHTQKAQEFFWVPPVTFKTIILSFTEPFAENLWMPPYAWPMVFIIYSLTLWVIYRNYIVRKDTYGLVLGISFFIFGFTILTTAIISLFSQPILFPRYIMNIVVMLLIPPAIFFVTMKSNWIKGIVMLVILGFGIKISLGASYFSYGPYKQSIDYLHSEYPEVKKIFHIIEVTAGPLEVYKNYEIENYWFNPPKTIVFTNMNVFDQMHKTDSLYKVLKKEEPFCVATFTSLPFNENNMKQVLSESQLLRIDTVIDKKAEWGFRMLFYMLKYKGISPQKDSIRMN